MNRQEGRERRIHPGQVPAWPRLRGIMRQPPWIPHMRLLRLARPLNWLLRLQKAMVNFAQVFVY